MSREKTIFNDYATALDFIKKGRNGQDRPVANNTRLEWVTDYRDFIPSVAIRLHGTRVVRLYKNGDTRLSSGGWHTKTTANRIELGDDFRILANWRVEHRPSAEAAERRLRTKYGLPQTWPSQWDFDGVERPWLGDVGPVSRGYGFWGEVAEAIGRKEAVAIARAYSKELRERTVTDFFDGMLFSRRGKLLNPRR